MVVINYVITLLIVVIFAKVILSFVLPMAGTRPHPLLLSVHNMVNQITEPFLGPLRRVLPNFGMFDFSPMVALIVLWLIRWVLNNR